MNDLPVGDLGQKVRYYVTLPSYKTSHGFPKSLPAYTNGRARLLTTEELTQKIKVTFAPDRKALRPEYFVKGSEIHGGLAYLILGLDELQQNNLAEGLIAKELDVNSVKVIVYDIIFVTSPYQKEGHMPKLIDIARLVERNEKSDEYHPNVAILRTKSDYAHRQYLKKSDKWDEVLGFKVHGFGFLNADGTEKFDGAKDLFDQSALKLASNPENFFQI